MFNKLLTSAILVLSLLSTGHALAQETNEYTFDFSLFESGHTPPEGLANEVEQLFQAFSAQMQAKAQAAAAQVAALKAAQAAGQAVADQAARAEIAAALAAAEAELADAQAAPAKYLQALFEAAYAAAPDQATADALHQKAKELTFDDTKLYASFTPPSTPPIDSSISTPASPVSPN